LDTCVQKVIELTRIQKLIGARMFESKRTKPCFYLESTADVTELMGMRPKLRKSLGLRITTNAFYIHALALAAKEYPLMLGMLDGDNIKIADSINVGFAVNAPQGLVVPVIRDADTKSLAEIAAQEQRMTDEARDNKLTLEQIEGETIALSNLGAYGIDSFFGIIPPPTSTILSVGNTIPSVVAHQGGPAVRKIASFCLVVDSRIITDTYAADFLKFLTEQLENPRQLV